jgi:hypothetical protein
MALVIPAEPRLKNDLVDIEKLNQEHYLYIQRLHLISQEFSLCGQRDQLQGVHEVILSLCGDQTCCHGTSYIGPSTAFLPPLQGVLCCGLYQVPPLHLPQDQLRGQGGLPPRKRNPGCSKNKELHQVERRKIKDVNSIKGSSREKKYETFENLPRTESKNSFTKEEGCRGGEWK